MRKIIQNVLFLLAGMAVNAKNSRLRAAETLPSGTDKSITARLTHFEVKARSRDGISTSVDGICIDDYQIGRKHHGQAYQEENKPTVLWLVDSMD